MLLVYLLIILIFVTLSVNCLFKNYLLNYDNFNKQNNTKGSYITINTTKYPYYHTFWSGFTPFPWANPTRMPYRYPVYHHNYYHNHMIPYYF